MLCTDCPDAADCIGSCCCTQEPESMELAGCDGCPDCDGSCDCHDEPEAPVATIAMVVALGENNLAMPCLTFATVEEAEQFLTARFGPVDDNGQWGYIEPHNMRYCADDFFFAYHDGCGGIDAFEVRTVRHGKPIVSFDLD